MQRYNKNISYTTFLLEKFVLPLYSSDTIRIVSVCDRNVPRGTFNIASDLKTSGALLVKLNSYAYEILKHLLLSNVLFTVGKIFQIDLFTQGTTYAPTGTPLDTNVYSHVAHA